MTELQPIIVFHGRHFIHHLGSCNRICVKLLQLMWAVITHNLVEKRSLYINIWLSYSQLFHGRRFVRHLVICNRICVKLIKIMFGVIPRNLKEKQCLYLKQFSWHPQTRHTHTHTRALTRVRAGARAHTHTHTHTHTHGDSNKRNTMHCISPKCSMICSFFSNLQEINWQKAIKGHWILTLKKMQIKSAG